MFTPDFAYLYCQAVKESGNERTVKLVSLMVANELKEYYSIFDLTETEKKIESLIPKLNNDQRMELVFQCGFNPNGLYYRMASLIDEYKPIQLKKIYYPTPNVISYSLSNAIGFRIVLEDGEEVDVSKEQMVHIMKEKNVYSVGCLNLYATKVICNRGFDKSLVDYCKEPVLDANGNPVYVLKPGRPKGSENRNDYMIKYDWKPEFRCR